VTVNGQPAELGRRVGVADEVRINGRKLALPKEKIYIKLNKPAGYVCTNAKFNGEKSVFDLIAGIKKRLFVVGRLDKDSRGLVILTNDGDWANRMAHPRFQHEKFYKVKILKPDQSVGQTGKPEASFKKIISELEKGVDIGEGDGVARTKRIRYLGRNEFLIILTEGKKRQIRRMFKVLGYGVEDLLRTRIGKVELGNLTEGKWEKIKVP